MSDDIQTRSENDHDMSLYRRQSDDLPVNGETKRSDSDRISDLYGSYFKQLSETLRRMYGDGPPDPEDVANEAFEKIVQRGEVQSIANLKGFVWRTARNIVFKARRDRNARSMRDFEVEQIYFPSKGDDSTPDRIIESKEQLAEISAIIETMPENRRRAFLLHRVDGLSVAETGRRLGMSRTGALKHIARAAAQINAHFHENDDQDQ